MNISKRDQKLLLILFGLVIFLLSYLWISKSFNSKQDDIQTQIDALSPQLEELRTYYANLSTYQGEIDRIESGVTADLSKYPSDVRSEDIVMYAYELQEKLGISIDSIMLASPEVVAQFSVPQKIDTSYELIPVAAMRTGFEISCKLDYAQMKKLIAYVYNDSKHTTIESVSVSYDAETGGLTGTVSLEKYFVISSNYTYQQTEIPSFEQGTTNPFGTIKITNKTPENTPPATNQ